MCGVVIGVYRAIGVLEVSVGIKFTKDVWGLDVKRTPEELRIRCKKVLNMIRDAFKPEYGNEYNILIKNVWKEYTGWPLNDMESEIYTETV
ncbi:hypothetical protein Droror1_Dr00027982 [Drosera rotundifolia]